MDCLIWIVMSILFIFLGLAGLLGQFRPNDGYGEE